MRKIKTFITSYLTMTILFVIATLISEESLFTKTNILIFVGLTIFAIVVSFIPEKKNHKNNYHKSM